MFQSTIENLFSTICDFSAIVTGFFSANFFDIRKRNIILNFYSSIVNFVLCEFFFFLKCFRVTFVKEFGLKTLSLIYTKLCSWQFLNFYQFLMRFLSFVKKILFQNLGSIVHFALCDFRRFTIFNAIFIAIFRIILRSVANF